MNKEQLSAIINEYFDNVQKKFPYGNNELLFGHCNNGEYNLNLVDIELLSEYIISKLTE